MYDKCGPSPSGPEWQELPCSVSMPARRVPDHDLHTLETYCPELVEKYGSELCCAQSQILDLVQNLALPQSIIARCPSCFYNFRQIFCELTCSPYQSNFLNVSKEVVGKNSKSLLILFYLHLCDDGHVIFRIKKVLLSGD